ncbi:MAG: membrane protein insertase YidC [Proteobacteria bacterium]|nr:membrane protein insertase YidC [Pseudomonadota bacterium]
MNGPIHTSEADTPAKFTCFLNGKVLKKEFKDITQQKTPDDKLYWPPYEGEILWTSFEDKYFISAILPQKELPQQVIASKPNENTLLCQLLFPVISLKPGESKTYTCALYLGPKEISILSKQGSKLEKCIDFGWFDIVAKPLLIAMDFFYRLWPSRCSLPWTFSTASAETTGLPSSSSPLLLKSCSGRSLIRATSR